MKSVGKLFLGIIFVLLSIIFVLLATVRFEVLNKTFLFGAFEKHNVYAQLPPLVSDFLPQEYSEFIKNIPPQYVKPIVENNLTQIIDYLNGQSKDVIISFSLPGIGFENASAIQWTLSKMSNKDLQSKIISLSETGNALIIIGFVILTILIAFIILYGRLFLLIGGIITITLGFIGKLISIIIGDELMRGQELSQKIIGLLVTSLSPDVTTNWLIAGAALVIFWLMLFLSIKKHEKSLE